MKITEGLKQGDLTRLIKPRIHIDEFASKMGDDDDIVVVSFKVKHKEAGKDLVSFIEKGYDFVLDADVSPGEMSDGDYLVFVELNRRNAVPDQILTIVSEVLNLTNQDIDEWTFRYGSDDVVYPLDKVTLSNIIPLSPKQYRDQIKDKNTEDDFAAEIDHLRNASGMNITTTAPVDEYTDALRTAAGIK